MNSYIRPKLAAPHEAKWMLAVVGLSVVPIGAELAGARGNRRAGPARRERNGRRTVSIVRIKTK
jgi:hypothetical protein